MRSEAPQGPDLVLASGSPRRRLLLSELGYVFTVLAPETDETPRPGEEPATLVQRLSLAKARTGRTSVDGTDRVVVAADTVVVVDDEILGKPTSPADAARMLRILAGRRHDVISGVTVLADSSIGRVTVETIVEIRPLSDREIQWYVETGEPLDKAGAYGIQRVGGSLVTRIDGSYTNVVGLPLAETISLLDAAGIERPAPPLPLSR